MKIDPKFDPKYPKTRDGHCIQIEHAIKSSSWYIKRIFKRNNNHILVIIVRYPSRIMINERNDLEFIVTHKWLDHLVRKHLGKSYKDLKAYKNPIKYS